MQCDMQLLDRIRANLRGFEPDIADVDDAHHAAVAITVTDIGFGADLPGLPAFASWQHSAGLILTRRSQKLRNHPGQWAFPGGRLDPGETPAETALREMPIAPDDCAGWSDVDN